MLEILALVLPAGFGRRLLSLVRGSLCEYETRRAEREELAARAVAVIMRMVVPFRLGRSESD